MNLIKWIILGLMLLTMMFGCVVVWILWGSKTSNPNNYGTVGEIHTPLGYKRVNSEDVAYCQFFRSLPLKGRGSNVQLYTGGDARFQSLNYAVVDLLLLSNAEQCADVCMRLRSEYLFQTGQYGRINFQNVNGKTLAYSGGSSRKVKQFLFAFRVHFARMNQTLTNGWEFEKYLIPNSLRTSGCVEFQLSSVFFFVTTFSQHSFLAFGGSL